EAEPRVRGRGGRWGSRASDREAAAAPSTTATALSTQIARDIRYLRPSAWVYWQAIEKQGGWGLIEAPGSSWAFGQDPGNAPLGPNFPNAIEPGNITPTKRFFALEQYSRFIHP